MTKVPQGFDFSFLNEEEARKILQVLERNEELQRAEKARISKLQKTKRDIRWLQGVTGEWFEEIQRKKFCNETDVSQMLKQPLIYRLRKETAKNDPVELQTSRTKNVTNQKNPTCVSSRPSFKSSFASLFSFRKSGRETLKLQSQGQKGYDDCARPPMSMRGTTVDTKIYNSPLENQSVSRAFVPQPAIMREGSGMPPPWDASWMKNEFFQVLDDLDNTLAHEQSTNSANANRPLNYGSKTQFSRSFSTGNRQDNITGRHKNRYNETSNMSIYDILRPGTPRAGFKTFSPRTRSIYDMYRTREPRAFKEHDMHKNTFGSTSLCFDGRQPPASAVTRHFTARSLHFPATTQNKSRFVPPGHEPSPKRTPLSSIIWNRPDSSRDNQNPEEFLRAPSPMEIDSADPRYFQGNRGSKLYHSQNVYKNVNLNAPIDNAMSSDTSENSENMPFYHQDNPFSRSFFSNTFTQGREQRFGQYSFENYQEESSSWSGFHHSRKRFTSNRDFEMISIEANNISAVHDPRVPFQIWEPFPPDYGTNTFRGQEDPYPWQSDFQKSPLDSMEISPSNENQPAGHFGTANMCSMTGSGYHISSSGLEGLSNSPSVDIHRNKERCLFGTARTLAPSFKASFYQIPDDRENSQSPHFQNSTVTLQNTIHNKPDSLPIRSRTEVTVTNSNSTDSLPLTETQLHLSVTDMNNEQDLNESMLEDKQLNKMGQINTTGEMSQPGLHTMIPGSSSDFQNPFPQDSVQNDFSASTTRSTKRLPRVFSRRDTSKIYTSHREKANELKKDKHFPEIQKPDSVASLPVTQETRILPSFPSPDQGCHQDLTVSNEDTSSIIKNNHWCSKLPDNLKTESPKEPAVSDTERELCPTALSTNYSKFPARYISCDPPVLSSSVPPDSSPSNNVSLDVSVSPPTTVFSRSLSNAEPSLEKREEKDNAIKNQSNFFAINPSGNQWSNDGHVPIHEEVDNAVKWESYSPFRNGKEKGRVRRHISCIEKLSKTENKSVSTCEGGTVADENESNSKDSKFSTIYCTLPRKSASFLINRQPESKIMAASLRNGPPPFKIKNNVDDLIGKYTSKKFSPTSPLSMSECSRIDSGSHSVTSKASETMKNVKVTRSASVRKGPLPFFIQRSMSCPSREPCTSTGRDERKKSLGSDTDTFTASQSHLERITNLDSNSSVRDCCLTKGHQKEFSQESTEKDAEIAASGTSIFTVSNKDCLPLSSDVSGKESGKTLHKFKTTSMFSVSGDDDNVKCLELVSIYYTLPRKSSKKFCDLLQQYTQNINSLIELPQVETEMFPNALERDKLNYSTQERSGTPLSEKLKIPDSCTQTYFSHTTENMAVLHSSTRGPSEPIQEMDSVGPDVPLQKEDKTRENSPHSLAKTPPGMPQSRKNKGDTCQHEILHTSLMLQEKSAIGENSEDCKQSINAGNSDFSGLPVHSEHNGENSQTGISEKCASSSITIVSTESEKCSQKDYSVLGITDNLSGSHSGEVKKKTGTDCQKMTNKVLSDTESQIFAITPALHKLLLAEETYSREPDLESLQSDFRESSQQSQDVNVPESRKVEDKVQKLARDQCFPPGAHNKNKMNLDDQEKGENKYSVKHRLAPISKASRKFPAKDLSPKGPKATVFSKSESKSNFGHLPLARQECETLSPEPPPKSKELIDESSLSNYGINVEKSENPLQVTGIANRETSRQSWEQKSDSILQLHQHELKNVSELPPKHENSNSVTGVQEEEPGSPAQLTFPSFREADLSDYQRRPSLPFPLDSPHKSTGSLSSSSCWQQQRNDLPVENGLGPHLYRSKSLKTINVQNDLLCKNPAPKVRGRHFSESTSIDNALRLLTLGDEFSTNNGHSRRFKSFSELSCDENKSWALYGSRAKTGPRSTSSISRPIDYGIFGKEQQLAFLENVKRSLTQGRLWKPSFLKNPGFLKDNIINSSNPSESLSSNSPTSQVPENNLSPSEPLNIYEEDPVDSDFDTDTTTDDEYYLDENDKESEL
ncbi:exophilin-5 [Ctenodactylus gundi]